MASLTPAYGRDYTNAADAFADFTSGTKDFVFNDISSRWDGKYCSERDLRDGTRHQLRYDHLRKIVVVWYEGGMWLSDPMMVIDDEQG